ncbi:SGNH hydrolase domain-containing protein [Salinicola peritrichatus]|uniref:SGNH hydrolase domain-containing protein n=1 Tax=Salinicola peritrichatus TaxID=1267424 RepID=UPI003B8374D6
MSTLSRFLTPYGRAQAVFRQSLDYLSELERSTNVIRIGIRDIFCDSQECYAVRNGKALYQDDDHPTPFATDKIAQRILMSMRP